jgi:hypothetical protein
MKLWEAELLDLCFEDLVAGLLYCQFFGVRIRTFGQLLHSLVDRRLERSSRALSLAGSVCNMKSPYKNAQ